LGIKACFLSDSQTPNAVEVLHQSNGSSSPAQRKIKYTKENFPRVNKIVISYSSKWFTPFITNLHLSEFFGVIDETMYDKKQWNNIISYLSTDTIKNFLIEQSIMSGNAYFNGLWQLSEVDFTRPWTDQEVKEEFGL